MGTVLEYALSAVVGAALLSAGLFFTTFPGWQYIKVRLYLKQLKSELEPVARAVGAKTKTEWVTDKAQVMYFFEFPEEKWLIEHVGGKNIAVSAWLTLEVGAGDYNLYVPSFTPPKQLSSDYQALLAAINRHKSRQGIQ